MIPIAKNLTSRKIVKKLKKVRMIVLIKLKVFKRRRKRSESIFHSLLKVFPAINHKLKKRNKR